MKKWIFFIFYSLLIEVLPAKTIYIVPYPRSRPELTFYHIYSSQDEYAKKWVYLREALEQDGYEVKFTFDGEALGDFTALFSITNVNQTLLENLKAYPKERCWLFILEPPVYLPYIYKKSVTSCFGKNFVLFDDLVDNQEFFKFYYPQPRLEVDARIPDFSEKKLCMLIAGNKKSTHSQELYSERNKAIEFFSNLSTDEFDLFGHGWEGYAKWQGPIKKKWETLKRYKFCICYENMKDQLGYISEKLFDCFVAGCVPVYWGATNIAEYVHPGCFIDRRAFQSDQELYDFLRQVDRGTYQNYLDAAKNYLASPESHLFSIEHFIQIIRSHLAQLDQTDENADKISVHQ
jgi:hypothetical protein